MRLPTERKITKRRKLRKERLKREVRIVTLRVMLQMIQASSMKVVFISLKQGQRSRKMIIETTEIH